MRVVDRGTVFDAAAAPVNRRFCTVPSLVRLESGRLVACLRAGSSKDAADEDALVLVSDDDARSWRVAFEGFGDLPPGRGRIRAMALTPVGGDRLLACMTSVDRSNPTAPLFHPETEGILPTRTLLAASEDAGESWTVLGEVPLAPHTGNAITARIMLLRGGRMALPYEAWKEYEDPRTARHHASLRLTGPSGLDYSTDPSTWPSQWPELAVVAHDPDGEILYWDQRLTVAPDTGAPDTGGLVAMLWTHDRRSGRDIDIHIAWGSPDAKQWTHPASTGIAGQICAPLALDGGTIFAAYVHRHHPPSLRAILSEDFGRTWTAAQELVFYEKSLGAESGMGAARDFADYWADMSIWTFGHPEPMLLPDGDIMVAYYAGDSTGMGIHWVRIAV
ncbi:MAG: sialidase family protein [Nitrososphaerales archaeon]